MATFLCSQTVPKDALGRFKWLKVYWHTHNSIETGEKAFDKSFNEVDLENEEA